MEINNSEQWKLTGDCSKCRREKYCSKPCTRCKRATNSIIQSAAINAMDKLTDGAYSATMNIINRM